MTSLAGQVREVAGAVAGTVHPDDAARLRRAVDRLDEPLRVAIAGRVKAGKSTLLNALVGQALAATDAAECTRCVIRYRDGPRYGATLIDRRGGRHDVRLHVEDDRASIDLDGHPVDDVAHVDVTYPSQHLRDVTLVDTPGVASISEQVSARAGEYLAPTTADSGADVVVYLMRHLHRSDSDFLEAFTDPSGAVDPVRAVGVLGRADELGAGRGDSMALASQVAARFAGYGSVAQRVSHVLPVSGLLAFTAATLRQREHDHLGALSSMPVAVTDRLAISADRFVADTAHCAVPVEARAALLDRLGLFGVRFCLATLRLGRASTADELEAELRSLSGIEPLRALLLERFAARADVLKAARVLEVVRSVARRNDVPDELLRRLGRVEANAHELEELRCLRLVQEGRARLPEEVRAIVVAALGGAGVGPHQRLGLPGDADAATCAEQARRTAVALRRFRARPLLTSEVERVLDGAISSVERVHHGHATAAGR